MTGQDLAAATLEEMNDEAEAVFKNAVKAKVKEIVVLTGHIAEANKKLAALRTELKTMSFEPIAESVLGG